MATNLFKQAAPANDPTQVLSLGVSEGVVIEPTVEQKITLGNSREPPV
jgi:hypothetical protein